MFDALSEGEIRQAVAAVRAASTTSAMRFVTVSLQEPDKARVVAGAPAPRVAMVVTYEATGDVLREFLVALPSSRVLSTRTVLNAQPMLSSEDARLADSILRADPRWVAALARRGITDLSRVSAGTWSAGYFGDSTVRGRIVRVVPALRDAPSDRDYLRPIEGLTAEVNLTRGAIESLRDTIVADVSPARTLEPEAGYRAPAPSGARPNAAITIRGQSVAWRQWRFHVAPDPREGAVLHRLRYVDDARERSVLYRASVSEMVVPYGDPDRGWYFRNAFDAGEFGLGHFAQPLRAGLDVPDGAQFIDATFANVQGAPRQFPRAIAVYERDGGLAWRHIDLARRSRELVVEWISSLGNYEYGFAWILHEDGTIEQRTTLTGILSVKGAAAASDSLDAAAAHGQRITAQLVAPHHQHFFAFRLDTDIDGHASQRVVEIEGQAETVAGATDDPHSAMTAGVTVLHTEQQGQRQADASTARRWVVQNTAVRNALNAPVGFSLTPGENARPLAQRSAWVRRRAGFLDAQLWVTPYRPAELYAAGTYPNQSRGSDGLPSFTGANEPIIDKDVVLWYVMGITHLPRPEDWPIMPVHVAGFKLVPTGYFDANPLMKR